MTQEVNTSRRTLLKGLGTSAVAAGTGAGLFAFGTGGAAADGNFESLDAFSISSDDGTVEYVAVYGDSIVSWDGFDRPAESFEITSYLRVEDSYGEVVVDETQINTSGPHDLNADSWGGSGEEHDGVGTSGKITQDIGLGSDDNHDKDTDWAVIQASDHEDPYGLPADPVDASHLEVDEDGASKRYTVTLRSQYTWYANTDATGQLFQEDFNQTFDVRVKNEPRSADAEDGPGEDGAVGA